MSYDEVEIEDMEWSEELQAYTYQCPCGDLFQITLVRSGTGGGARMNECAAVGAHGGRRRPGARAQADPGPNICSSSSIHSATCSC